MRVNRNIIDGINDRKYRLPNIHLISSLLCGHFSKWMNSLYYQGREGSTKCCPQCHMEYGEHNYIMHGDCVCNLAIPGNVPPEAPQTELHFEFLRFLNRLASHEMFDSWKSKDALYPIPNIITDNYLA